MHYTHYEFLVISFGLSNSPVTFMDQMTCVLRPYLDSFEIFVIDDILVYSWIHEKNAQHVRVILQTLGIIDYTQTFPECEFWLEFVTFLGHVVSKDGIMVDPARIEAICGWPRPTCVIEVQSFVGLVGYYKWFVKGFFTIAEPLAQLTRQALPFVWSEECESSFHKLKKLLTTILILTLSIEDEGFTVYCYASKIHLGYILMLFRCSKVELQPMPPDRYALTSITTLLMIYS